MSFSKKVKRFGGPASSAVVDMKQSAGVPRGGGCLNPDIQNDG